jgi:hypothetical protein
MRVADATVYLAGTPAKVTEVVPLRFVPVSVTAVPRRPLAGAIRLRVGTGAPIGRNP